MHDLFTARFTFERSLDRFNLATDAPHPSEPLSFFSNSVGNG
jgi:hypothetical protein